MAFSTLLGQARTGNAEAIAQLMNQQLQSRGVTIQASRKGGCLRLTLAGENLMTQQGFSAYVEQSLGRLGCPVINSVEIAAMETGKRKPLWQSCIVLEVDPTFQPAQAPVIERVPAMAGAAKREDLATVSTGGARANSATTVSATPQEEEFEADIAAIAAPTTAESITCKKPQTVQQVDESLPTVKRLPMPSRRVIALQWFTATLWGTLATLGITAAISALLIPVVASMTGMEQLSGFAVAILLAMQLIIGIPIAGLVIGYAQTRMLKRYLRTVGGWLLITPLGCLMGFFIAVIVHFAGHSALSLAGWANSLGQAEGVAGQLLSMGCTTLGVGFGFSFLGLAQFAILNGRLRRAQRWIGITGLSGMAAWLVGGGLFKLILPVLDNLARWVNMTPILLGSILAIGVAWFVFQALSSFSLAVLLRPDGLKLD